MKLQLVEIAAIERGDFTPALLILRADLREARQQWSDSSFRQQIAEIANHASGTQQRLLPLEHLTLREQMLHRGTRCFLENQTPRRFTVATGCERSLRKQSLHRGGKLWREHPSSALCGKFG